MFDKPTSELTDYIECVRFGILMYYLHTIIINDVEIKIKYRTLLVDIVLCEFIKCWKVY